MAHRFEPIKREPAYLKVYKAVEAEILSGELVEGAPLPTEADLCDQFGITRATIREGLRLLEQADLVQRGPAKRFYVKRPDAADVAAATSKGLALGGVTFREIWEALRAFYPPAARIAAKRLKAKDIAEIKKVHEAYRGVSADQPEAIVEGAVEFFQRISGALQNRVMLAMLQSLNMSIGASLSHVIEKTPRAHTRILKAQSRIIEALEDGNEDEAARWMGRHIDDLKRGYVVAKVDLEKSVL